jgi:hypothetical protein
MAALDLVSKFEAVKVKQSSLLPPEDLEYCKEEQKLFTATLKQLSQWTELCEQISKTEDNPIYSIEPRYSYKTKDNPLEVKLKGRKEVSALSSAEFVYKRMEFTIKHSLAWLYNQRLGANQVFVNRIVSYFEEKYRATIPSIIILDLETAKRYLTYEAVVETIRLQLGHLNFAEIGKQEATVEFQNKFEGYNRKPEQKGRMLNLPNFLHWSYYSDNPSFDHDCIRELHKLSLAVGLFELNELTPQGWLLGNALNHEKIDFERDYAAINGHKVEGVRFFKNRKMQVKFRTIQDASDFVNRFELIKFAKD